MKQAKIQCPHCGKSITVREINKRVDAFYTIASEETWKYFDKAFESFNRIFDRLSKEK
jgi:hypothetical protein